MAASGQGESGSSRAPRALARARHAWPVVLCAVAIVVPAAYVLPGGSRNPLIETTLWSLLVLVAFAGWGSMVRLLVAPQERVDIGLRVVWGAAVSCAIGGLLAALALMNRSAALFVVEAGLGLALAALARENTVVMVRVRSLARSARREPGLALVVVGVAGLFTLHYLAGIADWHTNPYDDDIAYLPFVRKMLDTGTVLEPFSLRRLSALGGQTFFLELVAVRAGPGQANAFDRSMCLLMIALLVLGHRNRARRVPWLVAIATVVFLLLVPSVAINTASYYSGVAFFLGLYRTLAWAGRHERRAWQSALPVALVGAAACTLRQNYLAVSAAVLAFAYAFRIFVAPTRASDVAGAAEAPGSARGAHWTSRLAEPLFAAVIATLALVPWFVVAWQSNLTFFYPVMLGTANPALQFQSGSSTLLREIDLQLWTLIDGVPLRTLPLFVLAAALLREKGPSKPLAAYVLGTAAAYLALIHGLTQGEPVNIGRYAFGSLAALIFATVLAASTTAGLRGGPRATRPSHAAFAASPSPPRGRRRRATVAAVLALVGLLGGLTATPAELVKLYGRSTRNIEELGHSAARSGATDPPETALYQRLQASVPAGERLAVMLDEPYHLDYARNPIWNLDMPGYSSLPPGIPYFKGSDAVQAYFHGLGVRYLAYVRVGYSRYHYRREYWVQMIFDEQEVWRAHAPYLIDFVDNLTALDAIHRRAFDERGLVVVDLEAPR